MPLLLYGQLRLMDGILGRGFLILIIALHFSACFHFSYSAYSCYITLSVLYLFYRTTYVRRYEGGKLLLGLDSYDRLMWGQEKR